MMIDDNTVLYQLCQEFDDVVCETPLRSVLLDYPLLYDVSLDMSGHVVLVPDHERPMGGPNMRHSLCVCLGADVARAIEAAGLYVIRVRDRVAFQQLYNRMQALFVRNERFDAQLRAFVDTGAGYSSILDACAREMGCACALVDAQFQIVCSSNTASGQSADGRGEPISTVFEADSIDLLMASRNYRQMRESRRAFVIPGRESVFMRNIFFGSKVVGVLAMRHQGDKVSARFVRFLLGYLAPFIEELYGKMGGFGVPSSESSRVRATLRSALSGDSDSMRTLASLLEEQNVERAPYMLMRLERSFTNEGAEGPGVAARRFEGFWSRSYSAEVDGSLFLLAQLETGKSRAGDELPASFPLALRDNLIKAGVSRPFRDLGHIDVARLQANAAFDQGSMDDPSFWCYRYDNYAFTWLLSHGCEGVPVEWMCHSAIRLLREYDETNGTTLLETLTTYVKRRYNVSSAARELFVARSTLLNRLERIETMTGIDLGDWDERVFLEVSLALTGRGKG